ncbi:MAG: PEGA domain-containing protein, partial [Myxococcaceae bacterium]
KARIALYGIAAAVVLGVSGALLYMANSQRAPAIAAVPASKLPARVRIVSDPPGAMVTFNNRRVAERTPCVLPPVPKGTYPLVVTKPGYNDYKTSITLPASGEASFPVVRLQPIADGRMALVLNSDPEGAMLSVDGTVLGKTPKTLDARLGDELEIQLEHPGFYSLRRQLKVTPQLAPVQKLKLERQNEDGPLGRSKLN